MKEIKFTDKATEEIKMYGRVIRSWLSYSNMTIKDLLEYKTAKKIYVEKTLDGYYLMCIKDGKEEQIGYGLSKYSTEVVETLFLYVGVILDRENNFKTHFSNEILKSLKE